MRFVNMLKCAGLCLFMLLFAGCSSKVVITEINQPRTEVSGRAFEAWESVTENGTYVIEKTLIADKEEARDLVQNMDEKTKGLFEYLPESTEKPVTVWVVDNDVNKAGEVQYPYVLGGLIITGKHQAEDGTFLAAVVEQNEDTNKWATYGAVAAAMGKDEDKEEKELAEYYGLTEDFDILGLSDARFLPQLCTKEEIETARKTAEAFYCYLNEKKGKEEAWKMAGNPDGTDWVKEKEEWLRHIGVDRSYNYPYTGLQEYKIKSSAAEKEDIVVTGPYADYEINIKKDSVYFMSNVQNLERFLYNNQKGIEKIRSWMEEAENAEHLLLNRRAKYQINERLGNEAGGYTDIDTGTIVLNTPVVLGSYLHELIHVWTSEDSRRYGDKQEDLWITEGFASYGAAQAQEYCNMDIGGYTDIDLSCFRAIEIGKGNEEVLTGIVSQNKKKEAAKKIRNIYQETGGSVEKNEFNHDLFNNILSAVMIEEDGIEPIKGRNEYPLYESFVKYVTEHYSLEQVIDAVTKEKTIEESFGKSFRELQQEWETVITAAME